MKSSLILICLIIIVFSAPAKDRTGWRDIIPLRSTRAQVEQVLGVLDRRCQCYATEDEIVRVSYSRGPCKGDEAGWNVPADTVLSLHVTLKTPLPFSEMKFRKEDFIKTVDDTVTSHYGNGEKGLRYAVSSSGNVESVWYGPSVKDNHLRCPGFPFTDGGITAYAPYYQFPYERADDVTGRLGEFGIRLLKDSQLKGYVIVYGTPHNKQNATAKLVKIAKDYLIEELGVSSDSFAAINGGYREDPTVELFLIPRAWPPPVSTPTLGGFSR